MSAFNAQSFNARAFLAKSFIRSGGAAPVSAMVMPNRLWVGIRISL